MQESLLQKPKKEATILAAEAEAEKIKKAAEAEAAAIRAIKDFSRRS